MIMKNKKHKIGLALSGGGARGFAHLGVILAMEKYGYKPDIISGVSAGSIVASLYCSGLTVKEILKTFSEIGRITDFAELSFSKQSILKLDKLSRLLEDVLPIDYIEQADTPIIICATDFDNGKSIGWTKGEIVPRIIASCSIPIVFPPVNINGVNYVDGGVLRNLPAWAIRSKCKKLIGSNCSPLSRSFKYHSNIKDAATRSFQLMTRANMLQDLMLCDHIIQSNNVADYGTFDVASMKEIVISGYDSASKVLEKIKK